MKIKAKLNYANPLLSAPVEFVKVTFKEEDLTLFRKILEFMQELHKPFLAIDATWYEVDFEGFSNHNDTSKRIKERKVQRDNLIIYEKGLTRYWIAFKSGKAAYADLLNLNDVEEVKHED